MNEELSHPNCTSFVTALSFTYSGSFGQVDSKKQKRKAKKNSDKARSVGGTRKENKQKKINLWHTYSFTFENVATPSTNHMSF